APWMSDKTLRLIASSEAEDRRQAAEAAREAEDRREQHHQRALQLYQQQAEARGGDGSPVDGAAGRGGGTVGGVRAGGGAGGRRVGGCGGRRGGRRGGGAGGPAGGAAGAACVLRGAADPAGAGHAGEKGDAEPQPPVC